MDAITEEWRCTTPGDKVQVVATLDGITVHSTMPFTFGDDKGDVLAQLDEAHRRIKALLSGEEVPEELQVPRSDS